MKLKVQLVFAKEACVQGDGGMKNKEIAFRVDKSYSVYVYMQ